MADKLVAVRIKQQDNTYSNEIPIGARAENVAYDNTKNLLQVLGTIDMYKGDVQTQLDALFLNIESIGENIAEAVDQWIEDNQPEWQTDVPLDSTLTSSDRPPVSNAVPKLIAVNESPIQGTKLTFDTTNSEALNILTDEDIDDTLSISGASADAKATGDAISDSNAATLAAMAPAYSTSATYAVGDYVNYNGSIYRCTTAITTAESWTSGHWTAVILGADLASQVSDLKTHIGALDTVPLTITIESGTITGSVGELIVLGTSTTYKRASFVPEAGKQYKITFRSRGINGNVSYIFAVDSNDIVLGVYGTINDSTAANREYNMSFGSEVKKVWVKSANTANQTVSKYVSVSENIHNTKNEFDGEIAAINDLLDVHLYPKMMVGIYTTSGVFNDTYTYALVSREKIYIGKSKSVTVNCPGYYIRVFCFPDSGTTGFTYTTYIADTNKVLTTSTLTQVAVVIRKDPSDSTALTDAEIADIQSKLTFVVNLDTVFTERLRHETYLKVGSPEIHFASIPSEADDSFLDNRDYNDIYDRYDLLCTNYPKWIQRNNNIGNDSANKPIAHYTVRLFDPIVGRASSYSESENPENLWETETGYRRILLTAGVHGSEPSGILGLLYFVENLLNASDKWALYIKSNFILEIIPVICPDGYDRKSRNNINDVNVNRDYIAKTSVEAQALTSFIETIKEDVVCAVDCHSSSGNYGYTATPISNPQLSKILTLSCQMISACAENWKILASEVGLSDYYPFAYANESTNGGTLPDYLIKSGVTVNAITAECVNFSGLELVPGDSEASKALTRLYNIKASKMIEDIICNMIQSMG